MWQQPFNPLYSLSASTLAASLPILTLFYLLALKRYKGYSAGLLTLAVAFLVAISVYKMPLKLAGLSTGFGIMNGIFPIGWIVFNAVLLYNLSVKSGYFSIVKDVISSLTEDRRLQVLLIGYCFGAFLEGSAGFGAPVAITAGMLIGLGFQPLYAAGLCLIANTAPVAFGGVGIAIITAGKVSGIDPNLISIMVARQLPLLAFLVPLWLVLIMSGWKGAKQVLPAILVTGLSYSITMFLVATFLGPMLPDIISSMVSILCLVLFLRVWKPKQIWRFPKEEPVARTHKHYPVRDQIQAWLPFLLMILFIGNWGLKGWQSVLSKTNLLLHFNSLTTVINTTGTAMSGTFTFNWLAATGTAILLATIFSAIILRVSFQKFQEVLWETAKELAYPMLTIASVLGFAYVANYSGITATLGKALTVTGAAFPFVSPFLGWLGVFITGSDTSSNALFSNMQRVTATQIGINPVLTVTANTTGGVAAKMISPQSIAVACAAVHLTGQESKLFRFTFWHSIAFAGIIGVITYIQAYYLKGMVPNIVSEAAKTASQTGLDTTNLAILLISAAVAIALAVLAWNKKGR